MSPMLQVASLLIVAGSLCGCNSATPASPSPASTTANTQNQAPLPQTPENATLTPSRGQTFSVVLPSAGDGGYQWHLQETFDTRVVRFKGQRVGQLPAGAPLGKFADEIFDFEAVGAGQVTLTFSQYRSWEGPSQASATRRHTVTVR